MGPLGLSVDFGGPSPVTQVKLPPRLNISIEDGYSERSLAPLVENSRALNKKASPLSGTTTCDLEDNLKDKNEARPVAVQAKKPSDDDGTGGGR